MTSKSSIGRVIHWFRQRANSVRSGTASQRFSQTVHTVETVECQERTMFIGNVHGNVHGGGVDVCPVCGARLLHSDRDLGRTRLLK